MRMADGNANKLVCAPVERLGGTAASRPGWKPACPGPALQKRPYLNVNFLSTRAVSSFPRPLSRTKSDETGPGGPANSLGPRAIPTTLASPASASGYGRSEQSL